MSFDTFRPLPQYLPSDLPCVSDKYGWPWNLGASYNPNHKSVLPKISIVTPSYNQGRFIEKTIRSVLLQNYPNLEYLIIDGASTDNTVDILNAYRPYVSDVVIEPDKGQANAINKGLYASSGDILAWLNSDDYYFPGTLFKVADHFLRNPRTQILAGHIILEHDGEDDRYLILKSKYKNRNRLLRHWKSYDLHQAAMFWRRELFEKIGPVKEDEYYIMDFDYWARATKFYDIDILNHILAGITHHKNAKTGDQYRAYHRELRKKGMAYWPPMSSAWFWILLLDRTWHEFINFLLLRRR